jgi:hypothetical protein
LSESSCESKDGKEEEEMIEEGNFEMEESAKEVEEERDSEDQNEDFSEEDEEDEWVPYESFNRKRKERQKGRKEKEQSGTVEEKEEEKREESVSGSGSESGSESSSERSPSAAASGAKLLTAPKLSISKKGQTDDGLQRRKTSSLEEVVADVEKGRMRKAKEKQRFEGAQWQRVENIYKWRWTFSKVPTEKKQLLVDLPPRNNITRLSIFSLYFSDDFLSFLLERREPEMETHWSTSGLKVNIQIIKQVCLRRNQSLSLLWNNRFFNTDVSIDHVHHWNQESSPP